MKIFADQKQPVREITRGLAMLVIVYFHAAEPFSCLSMTGCALQEGLFVQLRLMNAFVIPAFFFIAGMAGKGGARQSDGQQVASRFVYFLLISIGAHLIGLTAIAIAKQSLHVELFLPLALGMGFRPAVVWFFVAFAFVQVTFFWWSRGKRIFVIALVLGLSALHFTEAHNYWQVLAWPVGFVFFLCGYWVQIWGGLQRLTDKAVLPCAIAALALCSLLTPWNNTTAYFLFGAPATGHFQTHATPGEFGFFPLYFITALAGSVGLYLVGRLLKETVAAAPLAWLGRNSVMLLLFNGFAMLLYYPVIGHWPVPSFYTAEAFAIGLVLLQIGLFVCVQPFLQKLNMAAMRAARRVTDELYARLPPPQKT